ncbi:SDR family NAD(P)-dependent oxidoreductase [Pelolinea submarina]|uniref:CDP-paratose 2-epimerase n=1 Tax=Pelolinea submarina TaxID=913107 RepID=A0A347ZSR4_9CHLR|nr:SDR family NAD(P)-dependent oxidoreductase [Pelolinea submarina]REG11082.1 CDP-paratose 2-epimerase [Pelolinea submarina]BBB48345.1 CDP-paratose 2-epimerase [Pelolinea submarina]
MSRNYLITGGAGFIGSNYARRLLQRGEHVTIFDNLSRHGAADNLKWVEQEAGGKEFRFLQGDVRDLEALQIAVQEQDVIVHLAAQVAVTTSVDDPRTDFEINAGGTFNVLEAARLHGRKPIMVYASTNKVYGGLEDLEIIEEPTRYSICQYPQGIDESRGLDFHSPYGCSKGTGDQYMHDYARIYDIPTVVFRQSCIYGTRQFGVEDQGWVAWFIIAILLGKILKIYGDGKQVRDLLFVEDLLDAYDAAIANPQVSAGQVYNIGGGAQNAISIWKEFAPLLEKVHGQTIPTELHGWRPGDQKVYISDISKIKRQLNWSPRTNVETGIKTLYDWASKNIALFA